MPVTTVHHYTATEIIATEATHVYVFGDNMVRAGHGGQAAAARNQPNAVGIPTLWAPNIPFQDSDLDNPLVKARIDAGFNELRQLVEAGMTIVLPEAGVGTGIADLPNRAPKIHAYITQQWEALGQPLTFDQLSDHALKNGLLICDWQNAESLRCYLPDLTDEQVTTMLSALSCQIGDYEDNLIDGTLTNFLQGVAEAQDITNSY